MYEKILENSKKRNEIAFGVVLAAAMAVLAFLAAVY